MKTFFNGILCLYDAFRKCDDKEHYLCLECDYRTDDCPTEEKCPFCGGGIEVRLNRKIMIELALYDIRTGLFPYRLLTMPDDPVEATVLSNWERVWYWGEKQIWPRKNND